MELNATMFLIACPLVGIAGFVDSIAGGGGLITLPGYLIAGLPPINASATNKLSAGMGATVSFFKYTRNGFVNFKLATPCVFLAMLCSWLGAKVQMLIPEYYLKIIMLIALPITLLIVLNRKSLREHATKNIELTPKVYALALGISAALGFYDGLYGPATGTFLLIFFVKVVGMNIKEANGIAKAINLATNMGGLISFLLAGKTVVILGLVAGCCSMIGSHLGTNLFIKKGADVVRPIMITVMIIFIIKIVLELLHVI